MKLHLLALSMAFIPYSTLLAQRYHDALLQDVRGSVKEVVYDSPEMLTVTYDQEGKEIHAGHMEKRSRQYDADGYLLSFEFDRGGLSWKATCNYDSSHRLRQQISSNNGGSFVSLNEYDRNGNVVKTVVSVSAHDVSRTYIYVYTYLKFDERGNWLSRIRKGRKTAEFESRTVRYW